MSLPVDLLSPAFFADPYPAFARLRAEAPVDRCPQWGGRWVVTRYADVAAALRDTGRLSSRVIPNLGRAGEKGRMGRFLDANGKPTSDEAKAAKDPKSGQPVENGLRNMWVTETALTTALNTSYFAERVAYFSIVMGIALLLTGIGFLVLTLGGALGWIALPSRADKKLNTASAAT